MLRPNLSYQETEFAFTLSEKGNIFLAISEADLLKDVIPEGFLYENDKLSLLETDKKENTVYNSEGFYIFSMRGVEKGPHSFAFRNMQKGDTVSFILWISLSPRSAEESCGGELVALTSNHPHFSHCDVAGHDARVCKPMFSGEVSTFPL